MWRAPNYDSIDLSNFKLGIKSQFQDNINGGWWTGISWLISLAFPNVSSNLKVTGKGKALCKKLEGGKEKDGI